MWWLLGIAGLYLGYRYVNWRQNTIDLVISNLKVKIRHHRELARKGNHESLRYLQSLDAALAKVEKENSTAGQQILASIQYDGLYPPSAL